MSIKLQRTVSHFFDDDSETYIAVSTIRYNDGTDAILISSEYGDSSVTIHSRAQLESLLKVLRNVGNSIFE